MKNKLHLFLWITTLFCSTFLADVLFAQQSNCQYCHSNESGLWGSSKHANTQTDVANELAANWAGQAPDSVISGSQAEDCLSCHAPRAVTMKGGMTETQAMGYYFSTVNGKFTASTGAINTSDWPHVTCESCHNPPANHPTSGRPALGAYNSKTLSYDAVQTTNELCGQCHGNLKFVGTDHRIYNAWKMSRHGHKGQADLAGELAASHTGQTPDQVIAGEDCIACHAPTSVNLKGGMTEAQALGNFFSTSNGTFTSSTATADTLNWPNVSCITCHDPHNPNAISYFNSTTKTYTVMNSSNELCGQCHGNLRFQGTDHLSYNIDSGSGGKGIPDVHSMNAQCVDCHMYKTLIDGTNSKNYKGHSWSVFIKEPDGSVVSSCTKCHATMTADSSMIYVTKWKTEFQNLDSVANAKVTAAQNMLTGSKDSTKIKSLQDAIYNMTYAEKDESHGVHNHLYSSLLLNSAIDKANNIITGVDINDSSKPLVFGLSQNYPNPFNPTTKINFTIPRTGNVTLKVYDILGKEVAVLVNGFVNSGKYSVNFKNAEALSSGIYFYRLKEGNLTQVRKMVLLK